MVAKDNQLDVIFNAVGIKRANRRTKPFTFSEADVSSLLKDASDNRDNTGWPCGQHVVLTSVPAENNIQTILNNWKILTSKDADQPSTQRLYIPVGDGRYQRYDASSRLIGNPDMLQKLLVVGTAVGQVGKFDKYLAAIRTKPFILLAGISGTGKSRMVRQLARGCCPRHKEGSTTEDHPLYNEQKPGNFEMIPVRPNWHDSTELMGYVTRISSDNKPKYVLTPFVHFLVKAWLHPDVPFFLCLDEMNLAPVEQYFAEYLSTIESRKKDSSGKINTDVLVRFDVAQIDDDTNKFVKATVDALLKDYKPAAGSPVDAVVTDLERKMIEDKGLRIPPNLVVMGTVNMDETTCTFSRKVLDRAMSFELNDVSDMYAPANLAGEGDYEFGSIDANAAKGTLLTGKEAYDSAGGQGVAVAADNTKVGDAVLAFLENLNEKEMPAKKADGSDGEGTMSLLAKTPFKIAYRSRNEIMIYCIERIAGNIVPLPQALDEALSMKVLSRIEGDSQHVRPEWLQTLSAAIVDGLSKLDGYDADKCVVCKDKLADMVEQAHYGYTSFWMR